MATVDPGLSRRFWSSGDGRRPRKPSDMFLDFNKKKKKKEAKTEAWLTFIQRHFCWLLFTQ